MDEDELFGDFEDLETGEKNKGEQNDDDDEMDYEEDNSEESKLQTKKS